MTARAKSKVEAYCETWASSLALLLSRLSSESWHARPATDAIEYVPIFRVRVSRENELDGRQWFSFSTADATELLRIFQQQEPSSTTEPGQAQKAAIVDLVQQWAELAARALEADFGRLVLQVALEESSTESGCAATLLHVSDGSRSIAVLLQIGEDLATALNQRRAAPVKTSPEMASARIEELVSQGNLGLLMDVELGVMLQFGCRQATLREVLELAIGAVLELDREIQEPVDLLLNGRVVARGEVVVIDGNYGLRVTEVASARQRVDSL
jgi:flagellar motor switch protein FliN